MKWPIHLFILALQIPCNDGQAADDTADFDLGIEEALQRAERASEDVAAAVAAVGAAKGQQTQARSEWFPQLTGSLSYDRLLEPDRPESMFPSVSGGQTGAAGGLSPFFQENTWRVGLVFSQNLYAGGRTRARQAMSEGSLRVAELDLASARARAALTTVQIYYDAVLMQKLSSIAESALQQSEQTLRLVQLGGEQGTRPEFDVLRAQVAVQNQKPQLLTARMQKDQALLRLKQLLDIPLEKSVRLTSSLEGDKDLLDLTAMARQVADISPGEAKGNARLIVERAEAAVAMRSAAIDLAQSQHVPSISAVSNYGLVAYPESGMPESGDWLKTWTAGLQVNVPIFSGLRVTGEVRSAEADLEVAQTQKQQTKEQAALDTRSAFDELAAALALWQASAGTVSQAERAYQIAELRYNDGISTQLELSDARLQLQQAQANRARSARDLQVARVRVALLPHLPLNLGSGVGRGMTPAGDGTLPFLPSFPASQGQSTP
ncbi:MAG TPA: TolC family protein [Oligoflexus sp.]|uniref:TolC family protein n=1 Tax=Oligoflexus sp. TaxID=1971216 RepID=UPI002D7E7B00|nr:TolC family protein [Oligoflexus sp.]HET9236650.1 TolC family protein [Oligoflexus sp.]